MRCTKVFGLISLASVVAAANTGSFIANQTREQDIIPGAYIVEFEEGQNDEASLYSHLQDEGMSATKRMNMNYSLFKGASFQLDESAIETDASMVRLKIANLPVVKKVWPVRRLPRPESRLAPGADDPISGSASNSVTRRANTNDTYIPHMMSQVDKLQSAGFSGKGVRIAIIDSGVDYQHPALGGCFGAGCVVSFGSDLVGDTYNGSNTPITDADPYTSCDSHGTHVTGIIGARENPLGFTGAAPGAEVGMYRVFGCSGDTSTDVMVAAFNQAYEEGADVITASIGGPVGWAEEAWAVAVSRIVDAGVPCTVAAGNEGSAGLFYASSAADGRGVTAVASVENLDAPMVLLEGEAVVDGVSTQFGWQYGSPSLPNMTLPLWTVTPDITKDGTWGLCNPLKDSVQDLSGKIVLVEYDLGCGWQTANNLAAKGAEYILFYYYYPGFTLKPMCSSFPSLKGCGMVPLQQGVEWRELLTNGSSMTLNITDKDHTPPIAMHWPNPISGGYMDSFTSWGPTWEVDVVPSFAAVGGSVISTFPLQNGGYAVESGTSMATPLMAGIYALVIEARGTRNPAELRSIFSSTAEPKPFYNGSNVLDGLAPVAQQGAGLVQAYAAAFTTTLLNVSSISFNDSDHFLGNAAFEIRNTGKDEQTYHLGHTPALTMYTYTTGSLYPASFPNPIADEHASLSFSADSITIPAGGSASITVEPMPPSGLDSDRLPVYSGYITLNTTAGEQLVLPYLGVAGSLHDGPSMIDPDLAMLIHNNDWSYTPVEANVTWVLPKPTSAVVPNIYPPPDFPTLLLQLTSGTALLRVDIEPVGATAASVETTDVFGTKSAGSLAGFPAEWVQRRYFLTPFSGMTQEGKILPPGSYRFVIRMLRIFGDRERTEEYKTVTLVPFTIHYQCTRKRNTK